MKKNNRTNRIDLDNLSKPSEKTNQTLVETIRIKNIKTQQNAILGKILHLASTPSPNKAQIEQLTQTLATTVTTIEKICLQEQVTPANLTSTSRQIYSWMKFLTNKDNLQLHLATTYRVQQLAKQTLNTHRQEPVKLIIELTNLSGLYKAQRIGNAANLVISEGFINASEEVLLALVKISLFGKSQDCTQLIRKFANSEEYSNVLVELDLIAQVIAENPQGKFYNLDELFEKLNHEYFSSALVKPRLTWSQMHTYRKFGHYEPARDRVVMSLTLDDARIPKYVSEFVLYHELLHKYHGVKWLNGRRMVHTSEFRQDENKFKLYKEASKWLKQISCT